MKAVQLVKPGALELADLATPAIGDSDVLLRVLAAGVCQTDVHMRRTTEVWAPSGTVLGHESCGQVVEVGAGVSNWQPGDTVVVHPVWSCGGCPACVAGRQNACMRTGGRMIPAPTPGVSAGVHGGMAEYMVAPAAALVGVGDLDPALAATLTDAALTPYHSIRRTQDLLVPGATAVVIGAGGLGRMAVQILRAITAARVIVLDVLDEALDAVRDQVDVALRADDPEAAEVVLKATSGYGAEVVFDLVGNDRTLAFAAGVVAPYGAVRAIGLSEGTFAFETSQGAMSLPWGATVTRPYSGTLQDLVEVVGLARAGLLRPEIHRFPLDRALSAFDELEAGRMRGRAVLIPG
ncbi:alcohol dehydrogenase catalytic domain-containing protein [Amycolatopsis thermoflava]|uniref:alcohol dehydrogenase catalytic domain-containing protein n=1 Tax=Amycolatopsis thermoflava TaxID=84480 RepID=UPI003823101A